MGRSKNRGDLAVAPGGLGEAFTPVGEMWVPFWVDLRTGECEGSVYEADMRRAIPIYSPRGLNPEFFRTPTSRRRTGWIAPPNIHLNKVMQNREPSPAALGYQVVA
jgi:hypothetical protein